MNIEMGPVHYRDLLLTYLRPYWRSGALLLVLVLGTIGLELANPQLLRALIDDAQRGRGFATLIALAAMFLGIALVTQVTSVAETYVAENLGWKVTNGIRNDLAAHVLRLDPSFHNAHTPGEMIERIDGDVTNLSNFFSRFVVYIFGNAVLVIAVMCLLFSIDWRVGASMTAFTLCSVVIVRRMQGMAVPHWKAARQTSAELYGFIEERLAGMEDIRANGATAYTMRRLFEHCRRLLRTTRLASLVGAIAFGATWFFLWAGTAIALGFGAYLVTHRLATIGTAYLIFSYSQLMNRPVQELMRQLQDFQQAAASLARVQELFGYRSALVEGDSADLPSGALALAFEHVTFAYEDDESVLHDVSFALELGSVLGIVGRTGSGKTTISRLIFRLYDPQAGRVTVGGRDVRDLNLAVLRGRIGMVTQDIQLFYGTVRDNLTFFDHTIADERIDAALDDLGLTSWCRTLPHGLDTMITAGAIGLSAGEVQLLAFARVFLTDPGLVILDEASSRPDPATERRIEHATDRLLDGRTGIIIAHRLSTLERTDAILVLENGRVREFGDRAVLAADGSSRFAELLLSGRQEARA